jgi:hypothetical protein
MHNKNGLIITIKKIILGNTSKSSVFDPDPHSMVAWITVPDSKDVEREMKEMGKCHFIFIKS